MLLSLLIPELIQIGQNQLFILVQYLAFRRVILLLRSH